MSRFHGTDLREVLSRHVRIDRLLDTATRIVAVPSPTGAAGAAADALAAILESDGFRVDRPAAGHAKAPAVVARLDSGRAGRCLQLDGHLDTVHLPFVPPRVEGGLLRGSGSADMKGGVAAAVEALRALRDAGLPERGSVILTAHDLHEAPWGFGEQLEGLIREGIVGDGVLIPEPLSDRLPVVGRGAATWKVHLRRAGAPVHEVMRPESEPDVIAAGAELVARLGRLGQSLAARSDPLAGRETVFVGQIHAGEIYNQYPGECWLEGTRRWLPGRDAREVETELRQLFDAVAREAGATASVEYRLIRDAYFLDQSSPLVAAFREALDTAAAPPLPVGPKPFVDDGNAFWAAARVPAITHGPRAGGQHTVDQWTSIEDLGRVALVYALTAAAFCGAEGSS